MARLLPDLHGKQVLDLGCGKGRIARLALERGAAAATGIDVSEAMLDAAAAARPSAAARWVQANALHLPVDDAAFDIVVCALMMGHVEELAAALAETARVLRPGGVLLLSDFHPYATLRGWQRAFTDTASGRSFAIENHPHLFEDYIRCFNTLGIILETLEEPCHEGFPVVFILKARKKT